MRKKPAAAGVLLHLRCCLARSALLLLLSKPAGQQVHRQQGDVHVMRDLMAAGHRTCKKTCVVWLLSILPDDSQDKQAQLRVTPT
jgi:hypothetical protein